MPLSSGFHRWIVGQCGRFNPMIQVGEFNLAAVLVASDKLFRVRAAGKLQHLDIAKGGEFLKEAGAVALMKTTENFGATGFGLDQDAVGSIRGSGLGPNDHGLSCRDGEQGEEKPTKQDQECLRERV